VGPLLGNPGASRSSSGSLHQDPVDYLGIEEQRGFSDSYGRDAAGKGLGPQAANRDAEVNSHRAQREKASVFHGDSLAGQPLRVRGCDVPPL